MIKSNIIVISPHPDDLEIAMSGTVARLIESGYRIISIVVTDGRGSTNPNNLKIEDLVDMRKKEVQKSSQILGIKDVVSFGFRNIKLESNQAKLKIMLSEAFEKYKACEIYIPHPEIDKHQTHKIVADISIKVFKKSRTSRSVNTNIWCYEVWTPFPYYDRIEDISSYINIKTDAINAHKSQLLYKNYTEGILGLNRYRAVFNDFKDKVESGYAEVFIKYNPD
ncbi:MAG: PIG-L deacetylase family protein [Thermodesulfobacteriota bacterium]